MVVELIFGLARSLTLTFPVHLGHLLQTLEHGRHDAFVLRVDDVPDVELVATFELRFDACDKELGPEVCGQIVI